MENTCPEWKKKSDCIWKAKKITLMTSFVPHYTNFGQLAEAMKLQVHYVWPLPIGWETQFMSNCFLVVRNFPDYVTFPLIGSGIQVVLFHCTLNGFETQMSLILWVTQKKHIYIFSYIFFLNIRHGSYEYIFFLCLQIKNW